MNLSEYIDIENKASNFDERSNKIINDAERLFEELDQLNNLGTLIFRGVSNSKYKLYSSAQREFIPKIKNNGKIRIIAL